MLIEFTIGNWMSFKDDATLSMAASRLKSRDPSIDEATTFKGPGKSRLLRSAVLYGANASGKSNLLRGLAVGRWIVLNSSRGGQVGDDLPSSPFVLDRAMRDEPSFFEFTFVLRNDASYSKDYMQGRYGAVPILGPLHHLSFDASSASP